MLGEDPDETEDEAGNDRKRKRARGGDDLDDDFVEDVRASDLGIGLGEEDLSGRKTEEETSGQETSDRESDGDSDDSESSGDSGAEEFGTDDDLKDDLAVTRIRKASIVSAELPYTFPAPESHEDFLEIIEDVQDNDVPTVVQRIRTLYHPSLSPDNKLKLQVWRFYGLHSFTNMMAEFD